MSNTLENSYDKSLSQNCGTVSDNHTNYVSGNTVSEYKVPQICFKVPPFWRSNPELWFKEVENQFIAFSIKRDEMQFEHLVAAIQSPEISKLIADIILSPPTVNKYSTLKTRIINHFSEYEDSRLKDLLKNIKLGDQRPSQLLREMRDLASGKFTDEVLRTHWFQKLPTQIMAVISASVDTLDNLAMMADKISEVADSKNADSTSANISTSGEDTKIDILETKILSLTRKVDELSRYRSRSRCSTKTKNRKMSLSISRNRSTSRQKLCWYHLKFGEGASKCRKPCNFISNED